eukprot:11920801-Alexandrium_andersonii.AAC.2
MRADASQQQGALPHAEAFSCQLCEVAQHCEDTAHHRTTGSLDFTCCCLHASICRSGEGPRRKGSQDYPKHAQQEQQEEGQTQANIST